MEEALNQKKSFFRRKDIEISFQRYVIEALSAMALGLFASLLIGLIIKTIGSQTMVLFGDNAVSAFLVEIGAVFMGMMGPSIGVAVAWALKAPPLVLFSAAAVGQLGATLTGFGIITPGGPAGAFIAVAVGVEFGKMVSKETKVDILVTLAASILITFWTNLFYCWKKVYVFSFHNNNVQGTRFPGCCFSAAFIVSNSMRQQ